MRKIFGTGYLTKSHGVNIMNLHVLHIFPISLKQKRICAFAHVQQSHITHILAHMYTCNEIYIYKIFVEF